MVRGINKSDIFKDDQDKTLFLQRLSQNVIEGKCPVYAWVLMDNHVHLLFKSGQQGISAVMRKLPTWNAQSGEGARQKNRMNASWGAAIL